MSKDHAPGAPDRSDQAEHWFQRMHAADRTPKERTAFEQWRGAHPAHAEAYERTGYLYQRAADLRLDPAWREAAGMARRRTARAARVRRGLRWTLATAATLVVAVGLGWRLWNPAQPVQHFATTVGERRTIALDDGSSVVLDTDSALTVRYRRKHRDLVLERGQAQFSVARQPDRPFVVHAGPGAVRAVGTQFQVRKRDTAVQVVLLEGIVTVSPNQGGQGGEAHSLTLAPGERLDFGNGQPWLKRKADLTAARGWTRGELIFDRRPLAEVVQEMNRHTQVKLRLADPAMRDIPVSGAFYDHDQASFLRALEAGWSLHARHASANEIVLHR